MSQARRHANNGGKEKNQHIVDNHFNRHPKIPKKDEGRNYRFKTRAEWTMPPEKDDD